MAALWMCELAPTEVSSIDAFPSDNSIGRRASTYDRVITVSRDWVDRRVLRVLIVNDEQETADVLVRQVRRWGHTAHVAYDGRAALRVAAIQHPDVVLLDLEMPLMDGCQVARQLRRAFRSPECFIIAVAARADDERRQGCIEAGIDLLLIKPVDPSVVETLLLLECELVNRSPAGNSAGLTNQRSSQRRVGSLRVEP